MKSLALLHAVAAGVKQAGGMRERASADTLPFFVALATQTRVIRSPALVQLKFSIRLVVLLCVRVCVSVCPPRDKKNDDF